MKLKRSLLLACSGIIMLAHCDSRSIRNSNPIFEKYSPDKKIYKDELARELQSPEAKKFTYQFIKYIPANGKEYLDVDVIGDDLYAKAFILVKNWHKIEGIKRTHGKGYSGAELRGLVIGVEKSPQSTELVYKDLDKIID